MTVGAEAVVGRCDSPVHCGTSIVAAQARGRSAGDETASNVIDVAVNGQLFVRVTVQTVGRIDSCGNRSGGFRTGAVVTGVTGSDTVSGDVVLGGFDLGPVGNDVTTTTDCSRCFEGQIACPFGYCMGMSGMDRLKTGGVTGCTVTTAEGLASSAVNQSTVCCVTTCTTGVGICTRLSVSQQCIVVAGRTAGSAGASASYGHQAAVICNR